MEVQRVSESERSAFGSVSPSLIQRLKADDQAAWQRLLKLYFPLVLCWCNRAGMRAQDAADVVQEVFLAVSRGIASFRYSQPGDTFRGWLRTIARNKIHDHFRDQVRRPVAVGGTEALARFLDVPANESADSADYQPFVGLVHRAVGLIRSEFEDRTWQAFWLSTAGKQTTGEVAEHLHMSPGAVRQAKYKVLRRLRQELGDAG
jgi:RNA polymerase sigma-70 factor, ECF subfamily